MTEIKNGSDHPLGRQHDSVLLAAYFAPRWRWHAVICAVTVTIGVYLLLPYLEQLNAQPEKRTEIRRVNTVSLPPPVKDKPTLEPEPEMKKTKRNVREKAPKPELKKQVKPVKPKPVQTSLSLETPGVQGDFVVDFRVHKAPVTTHTVEQAQAPAKVKSEYTVTELDGVPKPTNRLSPIYPFRARRQKVEGAVTVEFTIDTDGRTSDLRIIEAEPANTFDEAALRAIRKWRFKPGRKNGKAVVTRVQQTITFELD